MDLTAVQENSEFAKAIAVVFARLLPKRVLEVGTYCGMGSTLILCRALKTIAVPDENLISIECNPDHYARAKTNLAAVGCFPTLLYGLSLPRDMLPTLEHLQAVTQNVPADIAVDHPDDTRAELYYRETNYPAAPDNMLAVAMAKGHPDFIFLDGAGSQGDIEFHHCLSLIRRKTVIALDDTRHIKNYRALAFARHDKRFNVFYDSPERFGFAFMKFDPEADR